MFAMECGFILYSNFFIFNLVHKTTQNTNKMLRSCPLLRRLRPHTFSGFSTFSTFSNGDSDLFKKSLEDIAVPRSGDLKHAAQQYECLDVDLSGGVATVTMNRPKKQNALNMRMWQEISDCFEICRFY